MNFHHQFFGEAQPVAVSLPVRDSISLKGIVLCIVYCLFGGYVVLFGCFVVIARSRLFRIVSQKLLFFVAGFQKKKKKKYGNNKLVKCRLSYANANANMGVIVRTNCRISFFWFRLVRPARIFRTFFYDKSE